MRLMAVSTRESHRSSLGERLSFHLHGGVTGEAELSRWDHLFCGRGFTKEIVTGGAVERHHATSIRKRRRVAALARLHLRLDGVQRRQVAGETLEVRTLHVELVTRSFPGLGPAGILAQVARFTDCASQASVRRDAVVLSRRPVPDDPSTVDDILSMTHMAIKALMRSRLPGLPGLVHEVTATTERGVVLDIIVHTVTAVR